jgi:hypothetical protein
LEGAVRHAALPIGRLKHYFRRYAD